MELLQGTWNYVCFTFFFLVSEYFVGNTMVKHKSQNEEELIKREIKLPEIPWDKIPWGMIVKIVIVLIILKGISVTINDVNDRPQQLAPHRLPKTKTPTPYQD